MMGNKPPSVKIAVTFVAVILIAVSYLGCSGKTSLSSPQLYGGPSSTDSEINDTLVAVADTSVVADTIKPSNKELLERLLSLSVGEKPAPDSTSEPKPVSPAIADPEVTEVVDEYDEDLFYGQVDIDDSASAVDDDIWRQFDLADEYHAMGVIANREASWEEAQYYFEKSIKVLADIDVEEDSSDTPEAVKYSELLEDVIADYQVTLRSLGTLTDDVSAAVLVERFGDLAPRLDDDSMVVYKSEESSVTYSIPIVMNDRVKSSIVYFQTVAHDAFARYLRRSQKYTPMMKRIIREYDLPEDLIYLSLVESGYNPHAYSWARAMGLWQFISSTGRLYGLDRSWWLDERKDPIKATHAACRFLKDLYNEFGAWELAMAAYNGGPGRVRSTMKKQKTNDFWKLKLRRQTMDYVPLIMAATIIAKSPEKYGFYDIEFENEVVWEEVTIDKCLELSVVAKELNCTTEELKELNPELLRKHTPPNTKNYKLKIPKGTTHRFLAAYDNMPSSKESSWVHHEIRRGETVSSIAAKYGVSQYAIMEANNMNRSTRIYAGKTLIVPVPLDREYAASQQRSRNEEYVANGAIYVVRSGDTMWDIAKAFGTTIDELRTANYINRGSRIYVGQKLKIPSGARNLKQKSEPKPVPTPVYASTSQSSPTQTQSKASESLESYKVRSGDTLWEIARKFGTTTARIRSLNAMGPSSRIYPGQILKVSGSGGGEYLVHRVRRGETLGTIARQYRTSVAHIRAINNIDDPDRLQVGDELRISLNN